MQPAFQFGMRQMVNTPGKKLPGTVIARADRANGEPLYLVRPFTSESLTKGRAYPQSSLTAW